LVQKKAAQPCSSFTGTTMDRPGLEHLLADVRQGKIDKVV
jgi:DNA invertase Pin-like site-specific DNA recombinase